MRIAVVNWNDRRIGGAESYLSQVVPALLESGSEVGFFCEMSTPADRASIALAGVQRWCVGEMGAGPALAALARWQPDLLFVHGLMDPGLEKSIQELGPSYFFAHGYYGTCLTGSKTLHSPKIEPCTRAFGAGCLVRFYPRRCGGINPLVALTNYRLQGRRLDLLGSYDTVFCASSHMREELVRNGIAPGRIRLAPYPIPALDPEASDRGPAPIPDAPGEAWKLLFVGRIEPQKGAHLLLEALPAIRRAVGRPVELVYAGDGGERSRLEELVRRATAGDPGLAVRFAGWVDEGELGGLMTESHLLVFPSIWPEPFGLVGLEAGRYGLPTAAFRLGGIPDWLEHGVNGRLAPADPPTPDGFARAVVECLQPESYPAFSRNARLASRRYTMDRHLNAVAEAFTHRTDPAVLSA